jgi:hypothetical protein
VASQAKFPKANQRSASLINRVIAKKSTASWLLTTSSTGGEVKNDTLCELECVELQA